MTTASMNADSGQSASIDILYYIQLLLRSWWKIALVVIPVTAVAFYFAWQMPVRYEATARLMFDPNQANLVSIRDIYDFGTQRREFFLTQAEILRSRGIAERVVDELDLVNYQAFDEGESGPHLLQRLLPALFQGDAGGEEPVDAAEQRNHLVRVVQAGLTVRPIRNTQLVEIGYQAVSPELAAAVPNAVARAYVERQMEAKLDVTERATSWLNDRLSGLREKLEDSERRLQAFQRQEGLVDVQGVRGLAEQELNDNLDQLLEARREAKRLGSLYRNIRANGGDFESLKNLPEVMNHPLIQNVKSVEISAALGVSELAQRYGPKHPRMIAARDELKSARAQLRQEVSSLVQGIEGDYRAAQRKVAELERDLSENKVDIQSVAGKEIKYDELKRDVEVNRQLYNTFLTRFREASEATGFESPAAQLVEPALPPEYPVKSRKRLVVLAAFVLSGGFAALAILALEFFRAGVRTADDVEQKLGQTLIGQLPLVKPRDDGSLPGRLFFNPEQRGFTEAIRTLRTGLLLGRESQPAKIVSITSSAPAEGKSTVAENLALALSQVERVVLVDTDLRRASLSAHFGLPPNKPGLADILGGSFALDECIATDRETGLAMIGAGKLPDDPLRLLGSRQFGALLAELANRYDRVILDTPPVLAVSDPLVVSRLADAVLYVVKADATHARVVRQGLARLQSLGLAVDGVVLNQLDTSRLTSYGEGYYGGYYGAATGVPAA
ncbi:GumC family protein [Microbulbifer sediminum]|uniref:GumC family protein n=1 Tax=Microbulbifer sediminum TaxID=2904250 RepID=UPI001F22766D|nr:polysaccharide biosynthesis tyrosine autokinase [Microbulbifer sediminum]